MFFIIKKMDFRKCECPYTVVHFKDMSMICADFLKNEIPPFLSLPHCKTSFKQLPLSFMLLNFPLFALHVV